jgi:hypothetical protein
MTFNSDYSVMFYTKLPSKKEQEKIYQAKYLLYRNKKYEWVSDDKPLSFCSDGSIYTHRHFLLTVSGWFLQVTGKRVSAT